MTKKGLILIFGAALISGFSIFINKYGVAISNPNLFAFFKNTIVALTLTGLILFFKNFYILRKLKPKQWLLLITIGIIGGGIPFLLFFKGLSLTGAAQGGFIHKTMFIYVVLLAAIFLKEKVSKNFIIGALLLLAGNLILLKGFQLFWGYGDLLVLGATLFWSTENIISKYLLSTIEPKIVAWGRMFFGAIFIFGYLGLTSQIQIINTINFSQFIWVLITSALLLGYVLTWYNGLKDVPVSIASALLLLGSPITITLGAISSGKITLPESLSTILILAGLVLILSFNRKLKNHKISYQEY